MVVDLKLRVSRTDSATLQGVELEIDPPVADASAGSILSSWNSVQTHTGRLLDDLSQRLRPLLVHARLLHEHPLKDRATIPDMVTVPG